MALFNGPGRRWVALMLGAVLALEQGVAAEAPGPEPMTLVVMDPLAKELACACVQGFGQRDYRKLATWLQADLRQPVNVEFSDDLAESLKWIEPGREVIVVGERASVAHGAGVAGLKCRPVCELTGQDGSTVLPGLFVARTDDPAKELKDIEGRMLLWGLSSADGKRAVALAALRKAGVKPANEAQRGSYGEAALDVLDSEAASLPIAVIPGYALRLLEGCGSITPGDLKVIGRTASVPFITVFLADDIPGAKQQRIIAALMRLNADDKLRASMESRDGFKRIPAGPDDKPSAATDPSADWPDWRGPGRDGRVPRLPDRLPDRVRFVWKKAAMAGGLAGLSVSGGRLLLAERDFGEEHDVYRCLDAATGDLLWRREFAARGQLDYGQSPRATPVIRDGRAYLLGAFGDLRCVELACGTVVWERQLIREFGAELPTWGMCATPLMVDDLLIVNPGAPDASLAALDLCTGETRWTTPGSPAAYSAFVIGEFGGRRQIVGYDRESLGGWDPGTGQRLWRLVPPEEGDFNVPTPIAVEGGVLVSTENNGTRWYRFDSSGRILPQPAGEFRDLAPDTSTPVIVRGRVIGAHHGLRCLEMDGLRPAWRFEDESVGDHATLIADDHRVLVITVGGELILLDAESEGCPVISRLRVFEDDVEMYSHPALSGTHLYLRAGFHVACLDLELDLKHP